MSKEQRFDGLELLGAISGLGRPEAQQIFEQVKANQAQLNTCLARPSRVVQEGLARTRSEPFGPGSTWVPERVLRSRHLTPPKPHRKGSGLFPACHGSSRRPPRGVPSMCIQGVPAGQIHGQAVFGCGGTEHGQSIGPA